MQDAAAEVLEEVVSDKIREKAEEDKKEAFYVSLENASDYEDFPCNDLGMYLIIISRLTTQCGSEIYSLCRRNR